MLAISLNLSFWTLVLLVLGGVRAVLPSARSRIDRSLDQCYRSAIGVHDLWLRRVSGCAWRNPPLSLPPDELCIVLSNHQCWADILLLQSAIARRGPLLKFLTKRELARIPIFGVIFWAFDFPLLRRSTKPGQDEAERRAADAEALARACDAVRRRPAALTNFAEGTRSSSAKIAERRSPYRHLLPPRVGGFASLVEALGDDLVSVIDVTIVSSASLDFWAFLSGRVPEVLVEAERIPASTLPRDREGLGEWLRGRWEAKDARLDRARSRR